MNKGDRQSCPNPRNADENTTETAYCLLSKIVRSVAQAGPVVGAILKCDCGLWVADMVEVSEAWEVSLHLRRRPEISETTSRSGTF